jgi:Tol biopolymer transport system component
MILRLALALALGVPGPAIAQEQGEPPVAASAVFADSPRPQQPPGQTLPYSAPTPGMRRLVTDVSQGTWMSLDVAPDGRALVMDILGDLYGLPVAGGKATRITAGVPFDTQPTYSRDGHWLAYISDRSGADNLWIAHPDGSGARQISFGDDDSVLVSPAWAPDGRAIYVSRYRPDLNNYELWRYDLAGATTLVAPIRDTPTTPRDSWRSTLGAVISPDGRWLYAARLVGGLDFTTVDHWTIVRRDLATGAETTIVTLPDGPRTALDPVARRAQPRLCHARSQPDRTAPARSDHRRRPAAGLSDRA